MCGTFSKQLLLICCLLSVIIFTGHWRRGQGVRFLSPGSALELNTCTAHGGRAASVADVGSASRVTADGRGGADRQLTDAEVEGTAVSAALEGWGCMYKLLLSSD